MSHTVHGGQIALRGGCNQEHNSGCSDVGIGMHQDDTPVDENDCSEPAWDETRYWLCGLPDTGALRLMTERVTPPGFNKWLEQVLSFQPVL